MKDQSSVAGGSITQWRWYFDVGLSDTVQQASIIYPDAGLKNIKLVTISDKGCVSDTAYQTTTVKPLPVADFKVSNPLCENAPVQFTDQSLAKGIDYQMVLGFWGWRHQRQSERK